MKRMALGLLCFLAWGMAPSMAHAQRGFETAFKKIEAHYEPAEAKPGQTVTLRITITLADGWQTYPTVQPEKGAKAQTNKIIFPETGSLIFVGDVLEPINYKSKAEPILGIDELRYYPGGGSWTRKVVVSPKAQAGTATSKIKVRLLVCDKENCLPPKMVEADAALKITEGAAVPVEAKYKAEVEAALKK